MLGVNEDPLLPVGRDCDCGHPQIWLHGERTCSVYGQHTPPKPVQRRPMSELIALCMETPVDTKQRLRERARPRTYLKAVG